MESDPNLLNGKFHFFPQSYSYYVMNSMALAKSVQELFPCQKLRLIIPLRKLLQIQLKASSEI